jgi:predicted DCC family thiol-disulfide oxidoreductase YuxK
MQTLLIVYDGACPFCSGYVSLLRLRAMFTVELLSARSDDVRIRRFRESGYRLDEGMLVAIDGIVHVGPDAMNVLALLSESRGILNRLQRAVLSRRWLSSLLYPWLRACRRMSLWVRRVPLIDAAK